MAGYDVVTPNLLEDGEVYTLLEEITTYEQFTKHERLKTGETIIQNVVRQNAGRQVFVAEFSAGATIAWKCSSMPEVSGAVCYYGSRIRDSLHHAPVCLVLLFFPSYKLSFDVALLIKILRDKQLPIWRYINLMPYMALPILSRFILTGHSFSKHSPSSKTRRKNHLVLFH